MELPIKPTFNLYYLQNKTDKYTRLGPRILVDSTCMTGLTAQTIIDNNFFFTSCKRADIFSFSFFQLGWYGFGLFSVELY